MSPKLTIAIPTYNRAHLVAQCLGWLLPQVPGDGRVEVLVVVNGSTDATNALLTDVARNDPRIRIHTLPENRGYSGGQRVFLETASGDYIAFLCDDDLYLPGQVLRILHFLSRGSFSFVAMNYVSFQNDPCVPNASVFAPEHDKIFQRGFDVLNYPSVGHFSGFVFNRELAQRALGEMIQEQDFDPAYHDRMTRGLVVETAVRCTATSSLPAGFIGARGVAARVPPSVDYNVLQFLCFDYLCFWNDMRRKRFVSDQDFKYRADLVDHWLPMSVVHYGHLHAPEELRRMRETFDELLGTRTRYRTRARPLLWIGQSTPGRLFLFLLAMMVRLLKLALGRTHIRSAKETARA